MFKLKVVDVIRCCKSLLLIFNHGRYHLHFTPKHATHTPQGPLVYPTAFVSHEIASFSMFSSPLFVYTCSARARVEWRGPSAIFGPSALLGTLNTDPLSLDASVSDKFGPSSGGVGFANGSLKIGSGGTLQRGSTESELEFQLRETEQLLEITLLKKKLRETELAMSNIIAQMNTVAKDQVSVWLCLAAGNRRNEPDRSA